MKPFGLKISIFGALGLLFGRSGAPFCSPLGYVCHHFGICLSLFWLLWTFSGGWQRTFAFLAEPEFIINHWMETMIRPPPEMKVAGLNRSSNRRQGSQAPFWHECSVISRLLYQQKLTKGEKTKKKQKKGSRGGA